MAAAAEIQFETDLHALRVPEHEAEVLLFPWRVDAERLSLSADELPWLKGVREAAQAEADRIMELRYEDLYAGRFESIPLDVDGINTASKVSAVAEAFGTGSQEHDIAKQALITDYSRKWAEATRKNTYEYFGVDEQIYDAETDMLFADGFSVDEMVVNGLTPVAVEEERELRKNDFILHSAKKALLQSPDADHVAVAHIAPCPDWAIDSYKNKPKSAHGGYAPEIEKLMIHLEWFDPAETKIYHEQIGVSGIYITDKVINRSLRELGVAGGSLGKTEIHGTQALVPREKFNSAFTLLAMLDQLASEESGQNIFMGEVVAPEHTKDYNAVMAKAALRRKEQTQMGVELAEFVEGLDKRGLDHGHATVLIENYIQDRLLEMSEHDPELARQAFDERTAQGFNRVRQLEEQGRHYEAAQLRQQTRLEAPPASSCGAGSCGLDKVEKSFESTLKKLLDVKGDEKTLKDNERACKNCGKKEIYYAFNERTVKKGCGSCGIVEVNGRRSNRQDKKPFTFMDTNRKTSQLKAA
jgi:ribosomal protein S27AE